MQDVLRDHNELDELEYLHDLIDALPYVASILNDNRQVVFSNEALLRQMGIGMDEILGKRPGEVLSCIHADSTESGCGTSENCQVCGAVNAILKCQETSMTVTDECRIRVRDREGYEESLDLEITATPFRWGEKSYIVFAARDISSEKRKEALERIFFHDVINTAGTLQGVVDLLKQIEDPVKIRDFIDLLSIVSQDLTEEILNQKSLLAAENGELVVHKQELYLGETLANIVKEYSRHELALNREILFVNPPEETTINTDPVLLKRVINNMIKNALEAISPEERITLDYLRDPQTVTIRVHNPGSMDEAVQKQIFQRSFSTKGKGRGLGTYSMKLLGEKYLKGKVSFSTSRKDGIYFCLTLPLNGS